VHKIKSRSYVTLSNFGRTLHTLLCNDCNSLHSYQEWTRFSFPLHPLQHFSLDDIYVIGVRCYLVAWIFSSLMITDVKYPFKYLLVMYLPSRKSVSVSLPIFNWVILVFYCWAIWVPYVFSIWTPYQLYSDKRKILRFPKLQRPENEVKNR
jgi:hypothetical protein